MATTYTLEELRANAGFIVNQVQQTKDPVYISQDGWAPVVMLDADTYLAQQQALMELRRIFVDGVPGVALPQVNRQPQSCAAVDPAAVNLAEPGDEPLYPTTSEARRDGAYYVGLSDNGNPLEQR